MNESVKYFKEFFTNNNTIFLQKDSEEYSKSICGTDLKSETLYILPTTHNLKNIENYDNLKYITINNYKIEKKEFEILERNEEKSQFVKYLNIWNIKQDDLELLKFFPNVTHLLISYIRKEKICYDGISYLKNLNTLCLSSVNKITDFNFLSKKQKQSIKHLDITYANKLTKLDSLKDFDSLETLSLSASTIESRKTVVLENINGIEHLSNLNSLEINYFKFDIEELKEKLSGNKLKQFSFNQRIYNIE